VNGDGSSLRAVFPVPVQGAGEAGAPGGRDGADIGLDPLEQCVPALGLRDAVAAGAQLLPAPDRGHRSSIHEIRARTRYLSSFCQQ
jgi:hypothetical protein